LVNLFKVLIVFLRNHVHIQKRDFAIDPVEFQDSNTIYKILKKFLNAISGNFFKFLHLSALSVLSAG